MNAATLQEAISEVCPVAAVVVVKSDDRTTWSFEPGFGATPEQIAAGQNVIDTIPVDYQAPPTPAPEDVVLYDHENRIRAIEGMPPLDLADYLARKAHSNAG